MTVVCETIEARHEGVGSARVPLTHPSGIDGKGAAVIVPAPQKPERFWSRVVKSDGCWVWTGRHDDQGYGRVGLKTELGQWRTFRVHRVTYALTYGQPPEGLQLDHFACDNKGCCNPAHVRPVTPRENALRSDTTVAAVNRSRTHCPQGHEYNVPNTYISKDGGRTCRPCRRGSQARYERRIRAERKPKPPRPSRVRDGNGRFAPDEPVQS